MANLEFCGTCVTAEGFGEICAGNGRFSRIRGAILVPYYDENRNRIFIDSTSVTLGADVQDNANMMTDIPFHVLPPSDVTTPPTPSDENYATNDEGNRSALGTGRNITFSMEMWGNAQNLALRIERLKCHELQVIFLGIGGEIIGQQINGDNTKVYGFKLNKDSVVATFKLAAKETVQMVSLSADFDTTEKSGVFVALTKEQLGYSAIDTLKVAAHCELSGTVVDATHIAVIARAGASASGGFMYMRGATVASGAVWSIVNTTTGVTTTVLNANLTFTDVEEPTTGNEPTYTINDATNVLTTGDKFYITCKRAGFLIQKSNVMTAL